MESTVPGKLVLVRHGQSIWNLEKLFTGWTDVDLTEQGRAEAAAAGRLLQAERFEFGIAFTSVLKRAIRTLWIMLDEMDLMWIPVERSWRLNERHYGALQGLNKAETVEEYGEEQVKIWRRSYDVPPPPLEGDDPKQYPFTTKQFNGQEIEVTSAAHEQALCQQYGMTKRDDAAWTEKQYVGYDYRTGKQVYKEGNGVGLPGCWI